MSEFTTAAEEIFPDSAISDLKLQQLYCIYYALKELRSAARKHHTLG